MKLNEAEMRMAYQIFKMNGKTISIIFVEISFISR